MTVQQNTDYGYTQYPPYERTELKVGFHNLDISRRSGYVLAADEITHSKSYSEPGFFSNVTHLRTEKWSTSELRLTGSDGKQFDIDLPFSVKIRSGDFVTVTYLKTKMRYDGGVLSVANHTTEKVWTYTKEFKNMGLYDRGRIALFLIITISWYLALLSPYSKLHPTAKSEWVIGSLITGGLIFITYKIAKWLYIALKLLFIRGRLLKIGRSRAPLEEAISL